MGTLLFYEAELSRLIGLKEQAVVPAPGTYNEIYHDLLHLHHHLIIISIIITIIIITIIITYIIIIYYYYYYYYYSYY